MREKTASHLAAMLVLWLVGQLSAQQPVGGGYTQLAEWNQAQPPAEQAPRPAPLETQVQLQQKQIELQQKQIETLQEMVKRLEQSASGATIEQLQTKAAELESRSLQAARRDQDLARAVDDLTEKLDNEQRNGPCLPANLKQYFLPSRTNETPLSIYGSVVGNYVDIGNQVPNFDVEFQSFFLLTLNDRFYLEAELEFGPEGVELGQGQLDWILNDWGTLVMGRFLAPLGFFNERIHPLWINKLPDIPLMFRQVSPTDFSQNGLQFRGARYLGGSPIKLEYSLFASNGMGIGGAMPQFSQIANLAELKETADNINSSLAYGGRLGFWVPEIGLTGGASVLFNGSYTEASGNDLTIWQLDAGWRQGNWDVRAEYAEMHQQARAIIGNNIQRRGLYAQIGYRPYDASWLTLQNVEFLCRYSFANFTGINPGSLDAADFATTIDLPVNRNQYTVGLDYWLYASLVLKFAYQINNETGPTKFDDNAIMAQMAWAF